MANTLVLIDRGDVAEALVRRGMSWWDLTKGPLRVSPSTLTRIRAGQPVSVDIQRRVLNRINETPELAISRHIKVEAVG